MDKGDGWNLEDFSIWNPFLSFRMPNAVRPYVMVLAGKPVSVEWEPFEPNKTFTFVFETSDARSNISVIFVPEMHYRRSKLCMWASDDGELKHNWTQQAVEYRHKREAGHFKRKVLKIMLC